MTKQCRCDNKLMLGTHAVERQTGQVYTASFPKTKPVPVRLPPALWRILSTRLMTCPICGKAYPCVHGPAAHSRALSAREREAASLPPGHQNAMSEPESPLAVLTGSGAPGGQYGKADSQEWRQEVASRVQQHRARRRRHTDRNA